MAKGWRMARPNQTSNWVIASDSRGRTVRVRAQVPALCASRNKVLQVIEGKYPLANSSRICTDEYLNRPAVVGRIDRWYSTSHPLWMAVARAMRTDPNRLTLEDLGTLEILNLSNTSVSDIEPIRHLVSLRELYLQNTLISNLRPLSGLDKLEKLDISHTTVADLAPLCELHNLRQVFASYTAIPDITCLGPLNNLENLEWLAIEGLPIDYEDWLDLQDCVNDKFSPMDKKFTIWACSACD